MNKTTSQNQFVNKSGSLNKKNIINYLNQKKEAVQQKYFASLSGKNK